MAASSVTIETELEERQQQLATAKATAAAAKPDALAHAGGVIAGLAAQIEALTARLADARRDEAAQAAHEAQQAREAQHAAQLAAFEERRAQHAARWDRMITDMTECESRMKTAWAERDALVQDEKDLYPDAERLGAAVGALHETGAELFDRMAKGVSPLRHMRIGRI